MAVEVTPPDLVFSFQYPPGTEPFYLGRRKADGRRFTEVGAPGRPIDLCGRLSIVN